jgi:hypothetical protein
LITLEMVKIERTIFALPFAFLGASLRARGIPFPAQIGWIPLAMIGARSAAVAFSLARPSDLRHVNAAFFTVNGWVSIPLWVTTSVDMIWGKFR